MSQSSDFKRDNRDKYSCDEEYEFKQQWLREQMRYRVFEFSKEEQLKIFCGTWNCNDKVFSHSIPSEGTHDNGINSSDPNLELKDWLFAISQEKTTSELKTSINDEYLGPESKLSISATTESDNNPVEVSLKDDLTETNSNESTIKQTDDYNIEVNEKETLPSPEEKADMYIIGLQEIVGLNPVNVVISNQNIIERTNYWRHIVENHINIKEYKKVEEKSLVGVYLLIYVRTSYISRIRDIRSVLIPTGVLGIMGNKGAVCIRFDIELTSMCVVCAHFHSGRENNDIRGIDYRTILEKAIFPPSNPPIVLGGKRNDSIARLWYDDSLMQQYGLYDHDIIIWMGDLNYRIDDTMSNEDIIKLVQRGDWMQFICKDQLSIERSKSTVFEHFDEGPINFSPTYKYQPGTDVYECRPDKKLRTPAWCDRILYRCKNEQYKESLNQITYHRANLMLSDHKPVYSTFHLGMRVQIPEKQRLVYQSLLNIIDRWENSTAPRVELLQRQLNFGFVKYLVDRRIQLPLKNIGGVFARWAFVPKFDEKEVCKRWLKLTPLEGVLAPGETIEITAKILIDEQVAMQLRNGSLDPALDEIVVLRMTKGSDFFISISAEVDIDTISGLNTRLDNIYENGETTVYYNEDD